MEATEYRAHNSTWELRCLRCGRSVRFVELGGVGASRHDRPFFDCESCGARNEIRVDPQPGLGTQPKAIVTRIRTKRAAGRSS